MKNVSMLKLTLTIVNLALLMSFPYLENIFGFFNDDYIPVKVVESEKQERSSNPKVNPDKMYCDSTCRGLFKEHGVDY